MNSPTPATPTPLGEASINALQAAHDIISADHRQSGNVSLLEHYIALLISDRDALRARERKLVEALDACIKQIEHLEWLRDHDCGPRPATLTEDIIADARKLIAATPAPNAQGGEK